jgi:uncharacterized protein
MNLNEMRYRTLSAWLKDLFGENVRKITVDAGLGCPNRDGVLGTGGCIYCNTRGSGTGASKIGLPIEKQIDRGIAFLSKRYNCRKFIAYFQSFTNTYGEDSVLENLYKQALKRPEVVGLAVGTRPDCVSENVLDILAELGRNRLVWIEYGLQSIHEITLKLINRRHGPEAFVDAARRTQSRNIGVVAHLILGLPGESVSDMELTALAIGNLGVQGVKLHPLYVVRGTVLEQMYIRGEYVPITLEEAVHATISVMEALPEETVIHRTTSDPHTEELVTPLWMLDKATVKQRLMEAMAERGFYQGSRYNRIERSTDRSCDCEATLKSK